MRRSMIDKTLNDVKGLIRVSNGEDPPDLFLHGAEIFDVFSNSLFRGNICVYKSWLAYVGDGVPSIGRDTIVVDAKNLIAVPGYIDAHGHADLFYNPSSFADAVVPRGATTVFFDAQDMVDSIGISGFIEVLKVHSAFTLKYLWSVPASYPPYPEVEGGDLFSLYDLWRLFSEYKECVSVSEIAPYVRILRGEDRILEKILMAKSLGKNVEGHTLGASYDKLNALVAAGITSCHEAIHEADLRNRLRLGLYTMVRHSSIRSDFKELCPVIKNMPKDTIMLVSDGMFAKDLCTRGYMDFVIREAIRFGLDPKDAIKMSTLNPARYFGLDGEIGSIAPGRIADILLLEDMENPTPLQVIERGRIVAEDGRLLVESPPFPDIKNRYNPFAFDKVDQDEFAIEWKGEECVPVIDVVDRTVTHRIDMKVRKNGPHIVPRKEDDARKAFYTRRERKHWGRGFVRGIGADIGGIASTVAHETHGLLVLGFDDADMALAANTVLAMGGGVVLADKGEVLHAMPLPQGGTMSDLKMDDLARELDRINDIMRKRGSRLDDPIWTIGFLTLTSIVGLRLTVSGLYDVRKGEIVF
jgi:adenine deaminase